MRRQHHRAELIREELRRFFLHFDARIIAIPLSQSKENSEMRVRVVITGKDAQDDVLMLCQCHVYARSQRSNGHVDRLEMASIYVELVLRAGRHVPLIVSMKQIAHAQDYCGMRHWRTRHTLTDPIANTITG